MQFKTLLLVLLLLGVSATNASPADELQATITQIRTMKANFTQTITSEEERGAKQVSGTVSLKRPRQFRWTLLKPVKQDIIATGEKIWIYDPRLKQASVHNQPQSFGNTPASFLSGSMKSILNSYIITEASHRQGTSEFNLEAKKRSTKFRKISLRFKGLLLTEMNFTDELGHNSHLVFSNVTINQPISSSEFQFVPPAGIDIIR